MRPASYIVSPPSLGSAATIKNVGNEEAYVGIIITIATELPENVDLTEGDLANLFGINNFKYSKTKDGNVTTVSVYVVDANVLGITNTATFYEGISVPREWNNAKMGMFKGLSITVTAYATQTVGFDGGIDTAEEALAAAFPGVWDNLPNA